MHRLTRCCAGFGEDSGFHQHTAGSGIRPYAFTALSMECCRRLFKTLRSPKFTDGVALRLARQ